MSTIYKKQTQDRKMLEKYQKSVLNKRAAGTLINSSQYQHIWNSKSIGFILQTLSKQQKTPQKCVIYIAFCHFCLQQMKDISQIRLQIKDVLLQLMYTSDKFPPNTDMNDLKVSQSTWFSSIKNSFLSKNNSKTKPQAKFTLLCQTIAQPYVNFLFYMNSNHQSYLNIKNFSSKITFQQTIICFNLLNSLYQVIKQFKSLGRYYPTQYANYIVLLTQLFGTQICSVYNKLKEFIDCRVSQIRKQILQQQQKDDIFFTRPSDSSLKKLHQTVKVLQQVEEINGKIMQLYMCKYFYDKIKHVQKPKWIKANHQSFSFIYDIYSHYKRYLPKDIKKNSIRILKKEDHQDNAKTQSQSIINHKNGSYQNISMIVV